MKPDFFTVFVSFEPELLPLQASFFALPLLFLSLSFGIVHLLMVKLSWTTPMKATGVPERPRLIRSDGSAPRARPRRACPRDTENWAGRAAFHSSLEAMASAALAPSIRSLISTSPRSRSFEPWMTTQGLCALVGIFHLRLHARRAEIELGPDARLAQGRDHALVGGDLVLVHHQHHHGPGLLGARHDRAFHHLQGREQARHADGEAGRRNGLGAEAADEAVIAPAAADRAEADGASVLVRAPGRSARPRRPGRCSIRGRARRRGR